MASVSCNLASAPHIFPAARIAAGIEASTMTSLGTCRFVMPLSESTMAKGARCEYAAFRSASISARCAALSAWILA